MPAAYVFPGEKVKCGGNDFLDPDNLRVLRGGLNGPTGRDGFASVYEPCYERIVLFGGQDRETDRCGTTAEPTYRNETWVWVDGFGNWLKLAVTEAPSPRSHHAAALDRSRKRIYIFGGRHRATRTAPYTLFDELWAFDINKDSWSELTTKGDKPSPRAQARLAYDYANDRVLLFGGNTRTDQAAAGATDDLYSLDPETLTWSRLGGLSPAPAARAGHATVVDHRIDGKRLYLFGGRDQAGALLGDLWALDLAQTRWTKLWEAGSGRGPTARVGAALGEDAAAKQLLLFAGTDATSPRNDVWWWKIDDGQWGKEKTGDKKKGDCADHCANSCDPLFMEVDPLSPDRRQDSQLHAIEGYGHLLMIGGKGRCGYLNDVWRLDPTAEPDASPGDPTTDPPTPAEPQVWTVVVTARQGLTCARRNPECKMLCAF